MKIVAEAGTSHGGSLKKAEEIIGKAADSGAEAVKFQVVLAREIIHPKTGMVPLPGGNTPLYDVFASLEAKASFYGQLKRRCDKEGVEFLATPFGPESWKLLRDLGVDSVKVASPELNYDPLLADMAHWHEPGKKVILSTGVSLLADVERALSFFPHRQGVTLLHCITAYPAPPEEYNLNILPVYATLFGVETGVSDHSLDPLAVPLSAVCAGAVLLEKHFCLSRDGGGLDDPIALDPADFSLMSREVKKLAALAGEERYSALRERLGKERVQAVMGTGRKELAPSEMANYGRTNRSVHALRALPSGTVLSEENTALLRTEKVLTPGIAPRFYPVVLGRKLMRDVGDGQGISWDDLLVT